MPPRTFELSLEEKEQVRVFVNSVAWRKVLSNARTARPPLHQKFASKSRQKNNDLLCQLQGWDLCENAIHMQIIAAPQKRILREETYPDPKPKA